MSERAEKREFVGRVRESWANWEREIARCPRARMESPGFHEERSLRDVIMHIAWYERQMITLLETRSFAGSPLWELRTEERNAIIYAENADRALDDVLDESRRVHARMMELLDGLSDRELNDAASFPGMPAEWAPWDVIASNTCEHYDGHAESMDAWVGSERETVPRPPGDDGVRAGSEPGLRELLTRTVRSVVADSGTVTEYRQPLVGFADAADPRFADLTGHVGSGQMLPEDLLPGARTVVSFFLPFGESVVEANREMRSRVASEWAVAYLETNRLIARVCDALADVLREQGFDSAAQPATGKFDRKTLRSSWSHKSAAVIAGVGTFGLHRMVVTEAGCAGRLGSLVTDAVISPAPRSIRQYCAHLRGETCRDCVARCPVGALNGEGGIDTAICWARCTAVADRIGGDERAEVCGKCAVGRCAMASPRLGD